MKFRIQSSSFMMFGVAILILASCRSEVTGVNQNPVDTTHKDTGTHKDTTSHKDTGQVRFNDYVAANSNSATSIGVRWNRDSTDVYSDTVYLMDGITVLTKQIVASPLVQTLATGLQEGKYYTFSVHTRHSVSANPVTWMAVARFPGILRVYEMADNIPGQNSGIVLGTVPTVVAVNNQNASRLDLVLASDPTVTSGITLIAPDVTLLSHVTAGRATNFADTFYSVPPPGLDNLYYTGDLRNLIPTVKPFNAYDIPMTATGNSTVIAMQTADNHFARVEVVSQPNGRLFGGNIGSQYIDLRISYQKIVNVPYATRGHAPALTSNSKHAIGHLVVRN